MKVLKQEKIFIDTKNMELLETSMQMLHSQHLKDKEVKVRTYLDHQEYAMITDYHIAYVVSKFADKKSWLKFLKAIKVNDKNYELPDTTVRNFYGKKTVH